MSAEEAKLEPKEPTCSLKLLKPEAPLVNSSAFPQDVHFFIPLYLERNQLRIIVKRAMGMGSKDKKGFTLIELLIVVGIIVALAAVIVPLVIQFAGKGDEGAWATEARVVQDAVDTVMADSKSLTITERLVAASAVITAGETLGITSGETMGDYIREMPTVCEYYWNDIGTVTQDVSAGAVCEP